MLRRSRAGSPAKSRVGGIPRPVMLGRNSGEAGVTPEQLASLMIIVSGAAHAGVNAILKAGRDKMASRALIDGISALLMLPVVFLVPPPTGAWGWLAASA